MEGLHPWEVILSSELEIIQFLTGGYPLAAFFFPYLLQTPHFPVPVPSSGRTLGSPCGSCCHQPCLWHSQGRRGNAGKSQLYSGAQARP